MAPDAVDHHPRGQRIGRACDVLGQPQPHRARVGVALAFQGGEIAPGDRVAWLLGVPPDQQRLGRRALFDDPGRAAGNRDFHLQPPVLLDERPQGLQLIEGTGQEVAPHEIIQEGGLRPVESAVAPGLDGLHEAPPERFGQLADGIRRFRFQQITDWWNHVRWLARGVVERDRRGSDRRAAVQGPRRPGLLGDVDRVVEEVGGVVAGRELDVPGKALPEVRFPLPPTHCVRAGTVALVIDPGKRNRVVLDDQARVAHVAAQHLHADVVGGDLEPGGLEDAAVLVRQQMRVEPGRVNAAQDLVSLVRHVELARLGTRARESAAMAQPALAVGSAEIPDALEMLRIEGPAGLDLALPAFPQLLPGIPELPVRLAPQFQPRVERAGFVAGGFLKGSAHGIRFAAQETRAQVRGSGEPLRGEARPNAGLQGAQGFGMHPQDAWIVEAPHGRARAIEDAEQRVVVLLADGVELVVVAPGARDREALESLRDDIDLVVRPFHAFLPGIDGLVAEFDNAQMRRA